jgi:hypothetical protein
MALSSRIVLVPVVAGITVLGVWVAGGVLTNDFRASMALTALWLALAGAAAFVLSWRRRALRAPVGATFLVTAAAIGGFLGWTTLRDRVVNERVVSGVASAQGVFRSAEHRTTGTAAIVGRYLVLRDLDTSPGPDLRVRLSESEDAGHGKDLGGLKGNRGTQQYALPPGVDLARYDTVVIWCRAFSATFGTARLRGPA